ncbi:MAG: exosortase/archaeosortase family protein [Candidatus Dormibacteraeota bacterium]|nr:exosortase/archaeosortase family protein [Candidatus Dormibacteraeota bacterium]
MTTTASATDPSATSATPVTTGLPANISGGEPTPGPLKAFTGAVRRARLVRYAVRHRGAWPAVAIVVVTVVAYHFTLASLFDFMRLQTPLAYVALLPFFCLGMVLITARRYRDAEPPMRDRQIDLIIGIPLLGIAVVLVTVAPVIASAYYWSDRADVVSMVLFAAGATIVVYGTAWLWRLKAAFGLLLLAWPALYLHVLPSVLQQFTGWTNSAMARVLSHLPLGATPGPNPGDVIISQGHGSTLVVSIGTACSGADTVLGFALIGGAVAMLLQGGRLRKTIWWIVGLGLTFALNIARLTSIIALAHAGHTGFALGAYHEVIGLGLFALTLMIMAFVLPWFGLRLKEPVRRRDAGDAEEHALTPRARTRPRRVLSRARVVVALGVVATGFIAVADQGLQPYAAFDDGLGAPVVRPFNPFRSVPAGWHVQPWANYLWASNYFGPNSLWKRYAIMSAAGTTAFADTLLTDDRTSLDTYNLLNCFLFHNYDIQTYQRIDLGGGVYGLLINYRDPASNAKWTTVSWAWPVEYKHTTYYERIDLSAAPVLPALADSPSFQPHAGLQDMFVSLLNGVGGAHNDPAAQPQYRRVDAALEQQAQSMVDWAVGPRA